MTDDICFFDLETKSLVDLIKEGVFRYAEHESTDILCFGYAFNDEEAEIWIPHREDMPDRLEEHIATGGIMSGWNVRLFDSLVYNAWRERHYPHDLPEILQYQLRDTMEAARLSHFPGALGNCGKFLLKDNKASIKNPAGNRLIKLLSCPMSRDPEIWHEHTQDDLDEMYEYCKQDVVAERELARQIPAMGERELAVALMHYKMNFRGVRVDLKMADRAIKLARKEKASLDAEMELVTGGAVEKCTQVQRIKTYLNDRYGLTLASLNKDFLRDNLPEDMPDGAENILRLRMLSSRSSVSKFRAMKNRSTADERIKGMFLFSGAGATGRTSSVAVQLQNLPRKTVAKPNTAFNIMERGTAEDIKLVYGPDAGVYSLLSQSVRAALIPADGHSFCVLDYSAIEARKLAWLAGDESTLNVFRAGEDVYSATYTDTYGVPYSDVTDDQRFIGKVMTLSLGFQGAHKALAKMARNLGVDIGEKEAKKMVKDWRTSHPEIVHYWALLERAIQHAMKWPGQKVRVGNEHKNLPPVYYGFDGTHLYCQLPSGRRLTYPFARRHTEDSAYGPRSVVTYAKAAWTPKVGEKEWPRCSLYGGLAAENITQASSRDLLMFASVEIEETEIPLVMTVHDEVVAEVPENIAWMAFEVMKEIMEKTPNWAKGLPLVAAGGIMKRYGKA